MEEELATLITKDQIQKIPRHVVLQGSVSLRDKYNNIWLVEARNVDGNWYLMDGWAKFVSDNLVTNMDLLAFCYSGPGLLDVHIAGPDGTIKESVGYRTIGNPKLHQNMESDTSEDINTFVRVSFGKDKRFVKYNSVKAKDKMRKEARKYEDDTDEYESDNDFARNGGQGYWNGEGDDESEGCDEYKLVYGKKNKRKEVAKELRKFRNDNDASGSRKQHQKKRTVDCLSQEIKDLDNAKNLKLKAWDVIAPVKRGTKVDCFGEELFESRELPRPKRYFVTKMKPRRMNELYIPMDILKNKSIKLPESIKLVDPKGGTYTASIKVLDDGRTYYKGWSKLCKQNHLDKDDYCICEFGEGFGRGEKTDILYINVARIK